jgi:hypothetical protein
MDAHNGKLIGLIGLGDAVFSLTPRDEWVGWSRARRQVALRGMMDAHILGAVPPYSQLLGSKLVALLAASAEVRETFAARYAGRETVISGAEQDGRLALTRPRARWGARRSTTACVIAVRRMTRDASCSSGRGLRGARASFISPATCTRC